jgi:hypothetical protein
MMPAYIQNCLEVLNCSHLDMPEPSGRLMGLMESSDEIIDRVIVPFFHIGKGQVLTVHIG